MKYLVLLIGDGEVKPWPDHTDDEKTAVMARFGEFDAACRARDGVELHAGEALSDSRDATVMRTTAGQVQLTDGPYAESKEILGGFWVIEAPTSTSWSSCCGCFRPTTSRSTRPST